MSTMLDRASRLFAPGAFLLFVVSGLLWVLSNPLMAAPDEPAHAIYAAAVADGQIFNRSVTTIGKTGDELTATETFVKVPRAYIELGNVPGCFMGQPQVSAACAPKVSDHEELVVGTTYTGRYSPLYYAVVGWPSRFFVPRTALYLMRAMNVIVCALLLTSAALSLRRFADSSLAMVGLLGALSPAVLYLNGTINPSGVEIAAAVATWAGAVELLRRPADVSRVRVALVFAALAVSRPFSPLLLVVILIFVAWLEQAWRPLRALRRLWIGVGLAMGLSLVWTIAAHSYDAYVGYPIPELSRRSALRQSVEKLPRIAEELVGRFGWLDTPLPVVVRAMWLVAVGAMFAVVVLARRSSLHVRVGLAAIAVATALFGVAAEVSRARDFGFIWQGRYSLPLAVGVPIMAGLWLSTNRRRTSVAVVAAVAVFAVSHTAAHIVNMQRFGAGTSERFSYLHQASWHPPVNGWILLVATMVVAVALPLWLVVVGTRSPGATAQPDRHETSEVRTESVSRRISRTSDHAR